jgi:hypothetical protein
LTALLFQGAALGLWNMSGRLSLSAPWVPVGRSERPAADGAGLFDNYDPLGFEAGDANLYRYLGNSPTNATDPTGLYLVITEDQKAKPIELFFGKDNVEYVPIPGKPGCFEIGLT